MKRATSSIRRRCGYEICHTDLRSGQAADRRLPMSVTWSIAVLIWQRFGQEERAVITDSQGPLPETSAEIASGRAWRRLVERIGIYQETETAAPECRPDGFQGLDEGDIIPRRHEHAQEAESACRQSIDIRPPGPPLAPGALFGAYDVLGQARPVAPEDTDHVVEVDI